MGLLLVRGGSQEAKILFLEAMDGCIADPVRGSCEEAVLKAFLVKFCLCGALQEVASSLGFDGQEALSIVKPTNEIGMTGGFIQLQRNALIGGQAAVIQECVMRVSDEVKHGAAIRERDGLQERMNPFNDGGFSHTEWASRGENAQAIVRTHRGSVVTL
jgi:hypothetical protein